MKYLVIVLAFFFAAYLSSVLGLIMQSYNMVSLKNVRKIAYLIPFMQIPVYLHLLRDPDIGFKKTVYYFFMTDKNIIFAQCYSCCIENFLKTHPHETKYQAYRFVAKETNEAALKCISEVA